MFVLAMVLGAAPVVWQDYTNDRYRYRVCYPMTFAPEAETANGDGRAFSDDQDASFSVWGQNKRASDTAASVAQAAGSGGKTTYSAAQTDWAETSGQRGHRIFYRKVVDAGDHLFALDAEYPADRRSKYAPVVAKIVKCFVRSGY